MDGAEGEAMHQVEDMLDSVRWEEEGASKDVSKPIISIQIFKRNLLICFGYIFFILFLASTTDILKYACCIVRD